MFKPLKNLILGYNVCRKYNINFKPWKRVSYSNASFQIDKREEDYLYTIWCSIFHPMFIPSLFHELAHCRDYNLTRFSKRYTHMEMNVIAKNKVEESVESYSTRLFSEVRANKYAIRYMKSCGMYSEKYQKDLEWVMSTYIALISNKYIANYHYQIMKVLRGELHENNVAA